MATTLADITQLIDDKRRDSTENSITNAQRFRAINSTLNLWNSLHDWPWTIDDVNFNYNQGIDTYVMPTTSFKFDVTMKPYKGSKTTEFWKVSENKFDSAVTKPNRYAVVNKNQKQYLKVKGNFGNQAQIETATAYDNNGIWVGASAVSGVATDDYEGFTYPSSVSFTYTGTSGTLTNSTFNAVDLQMFKNRSNLYYDVYISETSNLTSFSLKWGSSSTDYYTVTSTTDYVGNTFVEGWNRIKFAWDNPTTVGTPVDTAVNYLQLTIAYSSDPGGVVMRTQNFFVSENVPLTLRHYSNNMVCDVSSATQLQVFNDVTATTDYPLWSGQWDAVTEQFVNSVMEVIFWLTGEYNDMTVARTKIAEIVEPLKARYPSQRRKTSFFVTTDTNLNEGGPIKTYTSFI